MGFFAGFSVSERGERGILRLRVSRVRFYEKVDSLKSVYLRRVFCSAFWRGIHGACG